MKSGVRLHGGFVGTESSKAGRMPGVNRSILSGDLQSDDDGFDVLDDNSVHVVIADAVDDSALLEGFYVVGGNADGVDADSLGGGIRISGGAPTIINTRFNSSVAGCGGGVAVLDGGSPTMVNTVVNGNRAETGGGICLQNSNPTLINATITSNIARLAAGVYNNASSPRIDNSIIAENRSSVNSDDCEVGQYRCSFVDVPEDVLAASAIIMEAARDAWLAGSMDDALAYLQAQPNVISVIADSLIVGARVRTGTYDYLIGDSDEETSSSASNSEVGSAGTNGSTAWLGDQKSIPPYRGGTSATAQSAIFSQEAGPRNIIGDDRNGDGRVDNRDGKRALIIAPHDEGSVELVGLRLAALLDYRNQVSYWGPDTLSRDPFLTSFRIWDDYDLIYLQTKTRTIDSTLTYLYDTGLLEENYPLPSIIISEGIQRGWFVSEEQHSPTIWLTNSFFRDTYNGTLDNTLVFCAGCSSHFLRALDFRSALGLENAIVSTPGIQGDSSTANLAMIEILSQGFAAGVVSSGGTVLGRNDRIREVVNLYAGNNDSPTAESTYRMHDGADITNMIIGSHLKIALAIDGVAAEDDIIEFHYTVDGRPISESFTFATSFRTHVSGGTWFVVHSLELEDPIEKGFLPIEVLAVGGGVYPFESRFSAIASVDAFDCVVNGTIGGFRTGAFSGPSKWTPAPSQSASSNLYLRSGVDFATSGGTGGPQNYEVSLSLGPVEDQNPGGAERYPITFGAAGHSNGLFDTWGIYYLGPDPDCEECGGDVLVTGISADSTVWTGEFEFTGVDGASTTDDLRMSTISGSFRAMTGSSTDISTPYFQCLMQYTELEDASND